MKFGWIVALMLFVPLLSNFCRAGARADFYRHEHLSGKNAPGKTETKSIPSDAKPLAG